MIKVKIRFVDGGLNEFTEKDSLVNRLNSLKLAGCTGKELIHELITDDWAVPPLTIEINGTTTNGIKVDEIIPYD